MYIDAHAHIYHEFTDESARSYIEKARALGIEMAVAAALGKTIVPATNRWYETQIRTYGDFFVGLANVDIDTASPGSLKRLVHFPFVGFKVLFGKRPYGDGKYFPLWKKMQQLQKPVLLHTGWLAMSPRTRNINMTNLRPMEVDFIARNFPELKIIMAHLGYPWLEEGYCVIRRQPNVYADLSGGASGRSVEFYRELMAPGGKPDIRGLSKLLWASDHGYLGAEFDSFRCVGFYRRFFEACRVPKEVRERICRQNAMDLFGGALKDLRKG